MRDAPTRTALQRLLNRLQIEGLANLTADLNAVRPEREAA